LPSKQLADLFRVSCSWVRRVMRRKRAHGDTRPRPRGGVTVVKVDLTRLRELVQEQPDATVPELHKRLGIDCSLSAVDVALRRMGLSFKKRRSTPASRIALMSPKSGSTGDKSSPATMPPG